MPFRLFFCSRSDKENEYVMFIVLLNLPLFTSYPTQCVKVEFCFLSFKLCHLETQLCRRLPSFFDIFTKCTKEKNACVFILRDKIEFPSAFSRFFFLSIQSYLQFFVFFFTLKLLLNELEKLTIVTMSDKLQKYFTHPNHCITDYSFQSTLFEVCECRFLLKYET